jgi:hypothetical protein
MKFMIIVKATAESEGGVMPTTDQLTAMGNFNEEMAKAGILRGGEGLHPTSNSARVIFKDGQRSVVEGPFNEAGLMAGFWILEVASRDVALGWMMKCPNPYPGDGNVEIRQIFSADDFGDALTPEDRAREERLRTQGALT